LHLPDFRSAERTYQLLAQVGGRSGRGETPGEVVVQTYAPRHYSVLSAARHDYVSFYASEIAMRRELPYPPFTHLVNIVVSHPDAAVAEQKAQRVVQAVIEARGGEIEPVVLGPSPCPLARIKGKYRFHLLLKDRSRPRLHTVLGAAVDQLSADERDGVIIDVDPQSLL
jgi:Primosomal protein N'' (replication factor Y) - superfamily II helicase